MPTKEERLQKLLQSLFSQPWALRQHLRHGPMGDEVIGFMPTEGEPPKRQAEGAVQALVDLGLINDAFFDRLVEERGGRKKDIEELRGVWTILDQPATTEKEDEPMTWTKAATAGKGPWDIFVAYAGPDRPKAKELVDALASRCRVYWDGYLLPGDPWDSELSKALRLSRVVVFLTSDASEDAWYQRAESALVIRLLRKDASKHRAVPVIMERGVEPWYGFDHLVPIKAFEVGWPGGVARALVELLERLGLVVDGTTGPGMSEPWVESSANAGMGTRIPGGSTPPHTSERPPAVVVRQPVAPSPAPNADVLAVLRGLQVVDELAELFYNEVLVRDLYHRANIPAYKMPTMGSTAPDVYWLIACDRLAKGRVERGVEKLLTAALDQYPANQCLRIAASHVGLPSGAVGTSGTTGGNRESGAARQHVDQREARIGQSITVGGDATFNFGSVPKVPGDD